MRDVAEGWKEWKGVWTGSHGLAMAAAGGTSAGVVWLWRQMRLGATERRRNLLMRRELEAYGRLELRVDGDGGVRAMAARSCRAVVEASSFRRAAMLARDEAGRLAVVASEGMNEGVLGWLRDWGAGLADEGVCAEVDGERLEVRREGFAGRDGFTAKTGVRVGTGSFVVDADGLQWLVVAPLWTLGGRVVGAMVVGVEGSQGTAQQLEWLGRLGRMGPVEALAARMARTMENAALADRLLRSERLAGLGQLAGGVAHALNNPLTAVLGFAELIAETTEERRVREDATTIVREALRMRETVQSLLSLWRPPVQMREPVQVGRMVEELAGECRGKLLARRVRLVVQTEEDEPAVQGNRGHLRQVLQHLLNHSAQAVGQAQAADAAGKREDEIGGDHAIRVTVSHDERTVHVIVSDTGIGFPEPGRVFDPSYASGEVGEGAGLVRVFGGGGGGGGRGAGAEYLLWNGAGAWRGDQCVQPASAGGCGAGGAAGGGSGERAGGGGSVGGGEYGLEVEGG
jgi:signal transduction histidine kinase